SHPPKVDGEPIAVIHRSATEEIRINWCEYEGRPYVSIRYWDRDKGGRWWPDARRGGSIRLRELAAVRAALERADEYRRAQARARLPWGGWGRPGAERPRGVETDGRDGGPPREGPRPGAPSPGSGEPFREFDGMTPRLRLRPGRPGRVRSRPGRVRGR